MSKPGHELYCTNKAALPLIYDWKLHFSIMFNCVVVNNKTPSGFCEFGAHSNDKFKV